MYIVTFYCSLTNSNCLDPHFVWAGDAIETIVFYLFCKAWIGSEIVYEPAYEPCGAHEQGYTHEPVYILMSKGIFMSLCIYSWACVCSHEPRYTHEPGYMRNHGPGYSYEVLTNQSVIVSQSPDDTKMFIIDTMSLFCFTCDQLYKHCRERR